MLIGNAYSQPRYQKSDLLSLKLITIQKWGRYVDGNSNGNGASTTNGYTDNASKNTIQQRLDELKP